MSIALLYLIVYNRIIKREGQQNKAKPKRTEVPKGKTRTRGKSGNG